jgi:hypothetical protein
MLWHCGKKGRKRMGAGEVIRYGDNAEAGVNVRHDFSGSEVMRIAETAQTAMSAQLKAMVEARFVVAMKMRRSWDRVRVEVNTMCSNPEFAAEALYTKPIGFTPDGWNTMTKRERLLSAPKNWPRGFSIRAIEAIMFEMGNVDSNATIIYEDDEQRLTNVSVIDLERNTGYTRTVMTKKRTEKSKLKKDQIPISVRVNTNGSNVYLVESTFDEVNLAEASGVSKAIRTMGERLIRPDLKAEWRAKCEATIANQAARDPEGEKKKLVDAFAAKGVTPDMIESYIEHPLAQIQPAEIVTLRQIWTAIAAGELTWRELMASKDTDAEAEDGKSNAGDKVKEILRKRQDQQPKPTVATATPVADTPATVAPSAPAAPETTKGTPQDTGETVRDYADFPDPMPDGTKVTVKGVPFVSVDGNWRPMPAAEKPVKRQRNLMEM